MSESLEHAVSESVQNLCSLIVACLLSGDICRDTARFSPIWPRCGELWSVHTPWARFEPSIVPESPGHALLRCVFLYRTRITFRDANACVQLLYPHGEGCIAHTEPRCKSVERSSAVSSTVHVLACNAPHVVKCMHRSRRSQPLPSSPKAREAQARGAGMCTMRLRRLRGRWQPRASDRS